MSLRFVRRFLRVVVYSHVPLFCEWCLQLARVWKRSTFTVTREKEDEKNSAGKREDFHYIFYEFRFSGELVGSKEGF